MELEERIQSLYNEGLFLTAWRESRPLGPLTGWRNGVLAGRLAGQLGHPRLRNFIHLRNFRRESSPGPEETLFYAFALQSVRGPLATWGELRRLGPGLPRATARLQADWYAQHAEVLAHLRDFTRAERWQRRAEDLAGQEPWIKCVRADILHQRGDYEDARAVLDEILRERPNYPPACQRVSDFLQALGLDGEAEAFLKDADQRLECCWLAHELVVLLGDLGRLGEVEPWCARFAELAPLRPPEVRRWLRRNLGEAAYVAGDRPRTISFFRGLSPFHSRVAERLERNASTARVVLKVPFVRQKHMTCGPASIASLTAYWGRPVDHAEITRAICYDGTPDYRERGWLEEQGWRTREFTVTFEAARALLDRGIPFLLTTIGPGSGHAQAVIGYDEARRSLIINDPTVRLGEMLEEGLQQQAAWGPRGVVFVPPDQALPALPDEDVFDGLYRVLNSFENHRREEAEQALAALPADHPLTLQARVRLAFYDGDLASALALMRTRVERFPDDEALRLQLLGLLQALSCHTEYFRLLERHASARGADVNLGLMLGRQLGRDSRRHRQARRWLTRGGAATAAACTALAEMAWLAQEAGEAIELSRLASCLDEGDEHRAVAYYERAAAAGREEEALDFLRARFERLGPLSGASGVTLYETLMRAGRPVEALQRLEQARRLRPEDAELVLAEARARFTHGEPEPAEELLNGVRGKVAAGAWLTAFAQLEEHRGNLRRALELWRERVRTETAEVEAHDEVARLAALVEGPGAALEHLRQAVARHPHHVGLRMSLVSRLRHEGQGEPEVRELLQLSPSNAWAWRALALLLSRRGETAEALAALEEATALEPGSPSQWEVRGVLAERAGDRAAARTAFREYLQLTVENPGVLDRLLECASEPRQELADCLEWVERRPFGPIIEAWRLQAERYLERRQVIEGLLRIREAAPDCPESWTALILEYDLAQQAELRDRTAAEAAERFPLHSDLHQQLGRMHLTARRFDEACTCLERALELSRGSLPLRRSLAEAHRLAGRLPEARRLLQEALEMAPHEPYCLADLAEVLEDREEALECLVRAVRLEPDYAWAWNLLLEWSPERAREVIRAQCEARPGEASLWVRLAEACSDEEGLQCLERALALAPALVEAHDARAQLLARSGRFEEARRSLRAEVWKGEPPVILRGREAWLLAEAGDHAEAIKLMTRLLESEQHYRWGWAMLLEWLDLHGSPQAYRAAGERMIELFPSEPQGYVGRGDARLRLNDRGGLEDLRRALQLDGGQLWAAAMLLDAAFEAGDLKEADRLLDCVSEERIHNWYKLRLASRLRLPEAVRAELVRLAGLRPGAIEEMVELLGHEGWTWADLGPALEEGLLAHPGVAVARCWVKSLTTRWNESRVLGLPDAAFNYAGAAFVERVPGLPDLRVLVSRHRDRLRSANLVWGQVGAMFINFGCFAEAVEWLNDYGTREGIEPWTVGNLMLALQLGGRPAQALEVGRWAIGALADDDLHLSILAVEEALAGQLQAARESLARVPAEGSDYSQAMVYFTEALLENSWAKVRAGRSESTTAVRRRVVAALARRGRWLRALWEWW